MLTEYEAQLLQRGSKRKASVRALHTVPARRVAAAGSSKAPASCRDPISVAEYDAPSLRLTPRQLEVLSLLCEGLSNKLICRKLDISVGTAKIHVGRIMRELGAMNRLQAVVRAHRLGLASDPSVRVSAEAPIQEENESGHGDAIAGSDGFARTSSRRRCALRAA